MRVATVQSERVCHSCCQIANNIAADNSEIEGLKQSSIEGRLGQDVLRCSRIHGPNQKNGSVVITYSSEISHHFFS